jgi:hypothetical protein
MNGDNAPNEFWIYPWGKEIDEEVKIPWEEEKSVGELDTPVLGELNQPKNSKIPWRNKKIATKGSKELSMGSSWERERNKSEGVSFTRGRS